MHRHSNGKKRKSSDVDLEIDRSLYGTFVTAANSVSQLFSQAQQQQKRAHIDGQRQALERVVNWIARGENGGAQSVPTHYLLDYLRYELQGLEAADQQCSAGSGHGFPLFQHGGGAAGGPSPAKRVELQASSFGFVPGAGAEARAAAAQQQQQQAFNELGSQQQQQLQHFQHLQQQQQFGGFAAMSGAPPSQQQQQ